jgi:hypothetical protein
MRNDKEQTGGPKSTQSWHFSSEPPQHTYRRVRGYAFDPSRATKSETALVSQIPCEVPWKKPTLGPTGPHWAYVETGHYVEGLNYDPPIQCFSAPGGLDQSDILTHNGLRPSESNPQSHQQMAYAVAMTTIDRFEHTPLDQESLVADPTGICD